MKVLYNCLYDAFSGARNAESVSQKKKKASTDPQWIANVFANLCLGRIFDTSQMEHCSRGYCGPQGAAGCDILRPPSGTGGFEMIVWALIHPLPKFMPLARPLFLSEALSPQVVS